MNRNEILYVIRSFIAVFTSLKTTVNHYLCSCTFREEALGILYKWLYDSHNLHRRGSCHVQQRRLSEKKKERQSEILGDYILNAVQICGRVCYTDPSQRGHSRLGPSTMAILLGVILFIACCSDKCDRNWTRYLMEREKSKIDRE